MGATDCPATDEELGLHVRKRTRVHGAVLSAPMTRCLVLGGGLLGSHVARALADTGAAVTVFSRGLNPWFTAERRGAIEVHVGVVERDAGLLAELIEGADCVVHLASSSRPPIARGDPIADLEQTVVPALAVMERLAHTGGSRRLFFASSGGTIYGNPEVLPTPEDHPLRPTTPYAITSVALEHYAHFYARAHGLEVTTMRFSNVYGPGQIGVGRQGVIGTWLRQLVNGEAPLVFADLDLRRDFVYVDDAAAAAVALIDRAPAGTFNIGSGTATSLGDVLEAIEDATGRKLRPATGPISARHATADIVATQLDTTAIRRATGWSPAVGLVEGIQRTWEWMQAEAPAVLAGPHGQEAARS